MGELTFDESTHTYRLDGSEIPSVSQIVDEAGCWGDKSFFKSKEPAIKGTRIHRCLELYDKQTLDWNIVKGSNYQPYIDAWSAFLFDHQAKIVLNEDKHHMTMEGVTFAGTIDRILEIDGKVHVVDIKTGKSYPKPYGVQTTAYGCLAEDLLGYEVESVFCLHFKERRGKLEYEVKEKDRAKWMPVWIQALKDRK